MGFLEFPIALALLLIAVYVLAILLRVSCHFCGVEIPALGRALCCAALSAGLTLFAAYFIQAFFVGISPRYVDPVLQVAAVIVILTVNMSLSTAIYATLLEVRLGRAFSVWLVQAAVFVALGLMLGCCCGVGSML